MFTLVTGGSGSGKSEYAEALAAGCGCKNRWYLATMEVFGEEGRRKVERHRRQREGKGFATLECPRGLKNLRIPGDPGDTAVLLECVSNLAANEMFGAGEALGEGTGAARAEREVLEGILSLADKARELVVVTNEVGKMCIRDRETPPTRRWRESAAGEIRKQKSWKMRRRLKNITF